MNARGFTLIELIIIMVLLAILAGGVSSYIGLGATMYTDAAERERILSQSRFVGERMVRELRNAVPNSVYVDGGCLHFEPIIASGVYDFLNGNSLSYKWDKLTFAGIDIVDEQEGKEFVDRIVIYPTTSNHLTIGKSGEQSRNRLIKKFDRDTLSMTLDASFETESPAKRFYVYRETVSYCKEKENITRKVKYPGKQEQDKVVMAGNVIKAVFDVRHPTLKRNALVNLHLQFGSGNHNDMFLNYEVHIPNVP